MGDTSGMAKKGAEKGGGFEVFDHTADIGLSVYGSSLVETFENAARGMFHIMAPSASVFPREVKEFTLRADTREELLVAWLSELIYLFDAESFMPGVIKITQLEENSHGPVLRARVSGEPLDQKRHNPETEIKAVTYHRLELMQDEQNNNWTAQIIFDV
ncbi:MAG: archease [Firmicutes bacterium]|nr:archease [Bacillota bacterium]